MTGTLITGSVRGHAQLSYRASASHQSIGTVSGVIAPYNWPSADMGGYVDVYQRGCFTAWLKSRVDYFILAHGDRSKVLGRGKSGTARIWDTHDGLEYSVDLPDTSFARDLVVSMSRGDIDGAEAHVRVQQCRWENREGVRTRVIERAVLIAGSVSSFPDFDLTTARLMEE